MNPAHPDPNLTPQHPRRLDHLVGISRPPHPQSPISPPPPLETNTTALHQVAAAAATQVWAPEAWSPQYLVEREVAPDAKS